MQTLDEYPDDQIRQELLDFFVSWRPKEVLKMTHTELRAWKKHWLELKRTGWR